MTPATRRAREILTGDPTMSTRAVLSQLQSEGLACSPASVSAIARKLDPGRELRKAAAETPEQRIAATRAALCAVPVDGYAVSPDCERPPVGWMAALHRKLGVSRRYISRVWRDGCGAATRAGWAQNI